MTMLGNKLPVPTFAWQPFKKKKIVVTKLNYKQFVKYTVNSLLMMLTQVLT